MTGDRKLPGAIGERINGHGHALTVLSVTRTSAAGRLKPISGNEFMDVEVVLENTGEEPIPYNPFFFQLVGTDELVFQPAVDAAGTQLLDGILRPGEIARGHVAFEVPEGITDTLLLHYLPVNNNGSPATGSVWVDLSKNSASTIQDPEPSRGWPGEPLVELGIREEGSGVAVEVSNVRVETRIEGVVADKGNHLIVLDVAITKLTRDRAPYNSSYFRVKQRMGLSTCPPQALRKRCCRQGHSTRGKLPVAWLCLRFRKEAVPWC